MGAWITALHEPAESLVVLDGGKTVLDPGRPVYHVVHGAKPPPGAGDCIDPCGCAVFFTLLARCSWRRRDLLGTCMHGVSCRPAGYKEPSAPCLPADCTDSYQLICLNGIWGLTMAC
ncbi:hypothetical protein CENSYa_0684 [Cenarchaeum symbiosum A]|uniref:Uncharacterized protein n=1 Tax=Cenarchaeum symbiosum (strain A) TaxID=414004 RepID=A0RVF0_CENSY|nr:hypothetical protein CENSYa_0684 [Cenarchaeum symbiosum A]